MDFAIAVKLKNSPHRSLVNKKNSLRFYGGSGDSYSAVNGRSVTPSIRIVGGPCL